MPKRKQPIIAQEAPSTPRPIHVIDPNGVYYPADLLHLFKLRNNSVRREVREGRLSVAKRCGRYYILGSMLLDWLRNGTIQRTARKGTPPVWT